MSDNSFTHPLGQLSFGQYQAADVEPAVTWAEERVRERVEALLAVPAEARTFDNTVLALAGATEELGSVRNLVHHLSAVSGGDWHAVDELATEREAAVHNRLRFHRGAYQALVEARDRSAEASTWSAPKRKYLDEVILNYRRDGIDLGEADQEELKQIAADLSALEVTFARHCVEANDAAGLAVAEVAQLDGLSAEFIAGCRQAAADRGLDGYWVSYSYPNFRYVMANCAVRPTRQELFRLQVSLATAANLPVAQELLTLRRRMARLLGYGDFSDYTLELRMAKNGDTAANFIADLAELYAATAEAEHADLLAFARAYEQDPDFQLDASDVGVEFFYAAQLRAEQVGLEEEALRDYFTLEHVRDVLFEVLGQLYGIEIKPAQAGRWHDDVEVYELWDGHDHLSTVWCDWYARTGKSSGAWANVFYAAPRAGGQVKEPTLGCVVCNFPVSDASGHSRLVLRDVETIWHEFGHFVHLTVNITELRQQNSFACRWDFVEAPSQIMENWVWQEEVLARMAVHYRTGEGLPPDILAKLLASRRFRVGTAARRQLSLATEDLAMHRDYQGSTPEELLAFYRAVRQRFLPVPLYPEDAYLASFRHIFSGGYSSAYYSYKWAEAIEADLFSAFLPDKYLSREVGMRYRELVLARGAEVEPEELIRDFLGRDTSVAAMLARDGVNVPV